MADSRQVWALEARKYTRKNGEILVVVPLTREVDDDGVKDGLAGAVAALANTVQGGKLILDLHNVTYMRGSDVAALLRAHKRMRETGGIFILCNVQNGVIEVMKLTQLDRVFTIVQDLGSALSTA